MKIKHRVKHNKNENIHRYAVRGGRKDKLLEREREREREIEKERERDRERERERERKRVGERVRNNRENMLLSLIICTYKIYCIYT